MLSGSVVSDSGSPGGANLDVPYSCKLTAAARAPAEAPLGALMEFDAGLEAAKGAAEPAGAALGPSASGAVRRMEPVGAA
jgi:hypothetical protein